MHGDLFDTSHSVFDVITTSTILLCLGLVELLLDRTSDSTMQEKAARFEIISALSESPTSEAIFGEETVKRFKTFTKEGAVFVQQQTEVAIEKA